MPERIPRYKQVQILKYYFEGNSEVEIGKKLNLPQSTVSNEVKRFLNEVLLHRGLMIFRG